jgi:hypothetical protein
LRERASHPDADDLLDLVDGRVPLVIVLKHVPGRDASFAMTVVERLNAYKGQGGADVLRCGACDDIRTADPRLPCGLTAKAPGVRVPSTSVARRLGVDFISYSIDDLPEPAMLAARTLLVSRSSAGRSALRSSAEGRALERPDHL